MKVVILAQRREQLNEADLRRAVRVLPQMSLHDLAVNEFGIGLVHSPQIFLDR